MDMQLSISAAATDVRASSRPSRAASKGSEGTRLEGQQALKLIESATTPPPLRVQGRLSVYA